MIDYSRQLTHCIFNLSAENSLRGLFHQHLEGNPLPSFNAIAQIVEISRAILFPGYFGASKINRHTVRYHIGVKVEQLFELLTEQIAAALCFESADNSYHTRQTASGEHSRSNLRRIESQATSVASVEAITSAMLEKAAKANKKVDSLDLSSILKPIDNTFKASNLYLEEHEQGQECITCDDSLKELAANLAFKYIDSLSNLRSALALDVKATFDADPAATSFGEIICCYPGIRAISNYRMAHCLLKLGVPLIPRAISELAHSETGIDIHPGAQIGESFSIDHGTGVVIGETCIIGKQVKLYQGVTLGAKSIPTDSNGMAMNVPRHPILEDNVVVYSNATILGRITIGQGAIIGGNVWVTDDVKAHAKIVQSKGGYVNKV